MVTSSSCLGQLLANDGKLLGDDMFDFPVVQGEEVIFSERLCPHGFLDFLWWVEVVLQMSNKTMKQIGLIENIDLGL